ncbi:MAG: bifunctional DNA-binding transcriptional regulator/O6-methylguanine-DNA methyltransferase Ada, partial [Alphaproteobacteria bacterium]|nr:bifunctional DNA-binding transcriptional regulator/O6-methylguanine-DNA methyltransferase Ada [Alphaproteobacteria bacterium]
GVKTTGVYCRPGCTSRLPLRANALFFETQAEAEAAGLRPCKRCRPADGSAASRHVAAVERACALLQSSDTLPTLAELAGAAGISPYHFHRVFKQITGATPRDFARTHRLGRLADKLDSGAPVTEAIYAAGFGSSSRAYEAAPSGLGMTPGARRRGGDGQTIRFATVETPLGWALVAATERGICMTALADDRESLAAELRQRFPAADVIADDAGLKEWSDRIVQFITTPDRNLELPLDIRGTAFQARVWRALQKIPLGRTASYAEIAAALGQPKAVRAVAQACAANKLALLVPCHRVVRSGGDLGGYRWGVDRKRALLSRERATAEPADEAAA